MGGHGNLWLFLARTRAAGYFTSAFTGAETQSLRQNGWIPLSLTQGEGQAPGVAGREREGVVEFAVRDRNLSRTAGDLLCGRDLGISCPQSPESWPGGSPGESLAWGASVGTKSVVGLPGLHSHAPTQESGCGSSLTSGKMPACLVMLTHWWGKGM